MHLPHGETITRLRGNQGAGRYGDDTIDWTEPSEADEPGCAIDPTGSTEINDGRTTVVSDLSVLKPGGFLIDILPTDRVRVRGDVYEVVGEVRRYRNPFGPMADGDVVHLKRVPG